MLRTNECEDGHEADETSQDIGRVDSNKVTSRELLVTFRDDAGGEWWTSDKNQENRKNNWY